MLQFYIIFKYLVGAGIRPNSAKQILTDTVAESHLVLYDDWLPRKILLHLLGCFRNISFRNQISTDHNLEDSSVETIV
jgi:hypothetical protein